MVVGKIIQVEVHHEQRPGDERAITQLRGYRSKVWLQLEGLSLYTRAGTSCERPRTRCQMCLVEGGENHKNKWIKQEHGMTTAKLLRGLVMSS